ncbi:MAG6790 family protein [Mycoplasmopsis sturni]|uniref:MAG6790 family protein n=1 Tax=Mycoplasmopsis sturni TaxID=39047 RepID=UPI0005697FCD|nr:hypothetical protein [Mycoplasmopsis sturni]
MYKYKAKLVANGEIIAQENSLDDLNAAIKRFRRGQKHGLHTKANENIEIIHVQRDGLHGKEFSKEEIIKIV